MHEGPDSPGRRRCLQGLCSLPLALLLGCNSRPKAPLRIGFPPWLGYEPLSLAHKLGYYGKEPIQTIDFTSATQVLRAFRNGAIDAAGLTMDEVLLLSQDVPDLKVILALDSSNGADAVVAKPEIASLEGLRGRRVGYEATALGAYMLSRALDAAKLQPTDVEAISIQVDEHEKAYKEGRVDAVVTFDPARRRILAAGAKVIFDSSKIPNEILDVLVVRDSYSKNNPEAVDALVAGFFEALKYIEKNRADANERMSSRLRLSPAEVDEMYARVNLFDFSENRSLCTGSPMPISAPMQPRLSSAHVGRAAAPGRRGDVEGEARRAPHGRGAPFRGGIPSASKGRRMDVGPLARQGGGARRGGKTLSNGRHAHGHRRAQAQ